MRGVDIDQFFAAQQEMTDTFETGSLGYRGLTGPSTRRPSGLVARLYERMRRKSSCCSAGPTTCSSFDTKDPPSTSSPTPPFLLPLPPANEIAEPDADVQTPTNPPPLALPLLLAIGFGNQSRPESRPSSSLASSRRSSLRRQDGVDQDHLTEAEEDNVTAELEPDSLPVAYVTPPPSTIFSQVSLDMPEAQYEVGHLEFHSFQFSIF